MKKRKIRILFTSIIASMFLTMTSCGNSPSEHTHSWSTSWSSDETYHWHTCTGCDAINDKAEHTFVTTVIEPDYDHQGYTHHECSICEYSYNDNYVDPLEHHYSSTWSKDESAHWHACIDEGYETLTKDYALHDFGEWIIDEPATETAKGRKHRTCEKCSYRQEAIIPIGGETVANRIYTSSDAATLIVGSINIISKPVVFPNGAYENLKYVSSDESVLTVRNEIVEAKSEGSALVTIYNDNDNDGTFDENEPVTYVGYQVNPKLDITVTTSISECDLILGENKSFTVNAVGADVDEGIKYYSYVSTNKEVAIAKSNRIYALKEGVADIYVAYKGHQCSTPIHVTVSFDVSGTEKGPIYLSEDSVALNKLQQKDVALTISNADKTSGCQISSSNPDIATASLDLEHNKISVTAVSAGESVITVKTSVGRIARMLVTVTDSETHYDSSKYYDGYYNGLSWTDSNDLLNKLKVIMRNNKKSLVYDNNWEQNRAADENDYYRDLVSSIYSSVDLTKVQTTTGWQREHAFAASLMTGSSTGLATKTLGRSTDFHNLFAAFSSGNSARSNRNLGYADPFSVGYVGPDSLVDKRGDYAYEEARSFEPSDVDKGQLARSIFYMATMYSEEENMIYTSSGKSINYVMSPLSLHNSYVDYSSSRLAFNDFSESATGPKSVLASKYRELVKLEQPTISEAQLNEESYEMYLSKNSPYAIGNLKDLLKWNAFNVSLAEAKHNNFVYKGTTSYGKQGNRNPFVDYPQLVEYVFGSLKGQPGDINNLIPSAESLGLFKDGSPYHLAMNTTDITYDVGDTITLSSLITKSGMCVINDEFTVSLASAAAYINSFDKNNHVVTLEEVESGIEGIINTNLGNNLNIHIKVNDPNQHTFDTCKYSFKPSDGNKNDYSNPSGDKVTWIATFGGVKFDVIFGNATTYFQNRNAEKNPTSPGATFGSGNSPISSFTLVSQESYTNVNAMFFYALTNKNDSWAYDMYVGDTKVLSGSLAGNEPTYYGGNFTSLNGKVKLVIPNINGFSFCGLAFNYQ